MQEAPLCRFLRGLVVRICMKQAIQVHFVGEETSACEKGKASSDVAS